MNVFNEALALQRLGTGVSQRRISLNLTQQELAEQSGISKRTLERLENGLPVQTPNLLAVLARLDVLEAIFRQIPGEGVSPIQQVRALMKGSPRQRVRRTATPAPSTNDDGWVWGDEK